MAPDAQVLHLSYLCVIYDAIGSSLPILFANSATLIPGIAFAMLKWNYETRKRNK